MHIHAELPSVSSVFFPHLHGILGSPFYQKKGPSPFPDQGLSRIVRRRPAIWHQISVGSSNNTFFPTWYVGARAVVRLPLLRPLVVDNVNADINIDDAGVQDPDSWYNP